MQGKLEYFDMKPQIETTHDLADWIIATFPSNVPDGSLLLTEYVSGLLNAPATPWKKCNKCWKIQSIMEEFDLYESKGINSSTGQCKSCRRIVRNAYKRKVRHSKTIPAGDLSEIQRHRAMAGLAPLPYGDNAPPMGRPTGERKAQLEAQYAKIREAQNAE